MTKIPSHTFSFAKEGIACDAARAVRKVRRFIVVVKQTKYIKDESG